MFVFWFFGKFPGIKPQLNGIDGENSNKFIIIELDWGPFFRFNQNFWNRYLLEYVKTAVSGLYCWQRTHLYLLQSAHLFFEHVFKTFIFFLFAVSGKWYTTGISKGGFGCVTPPEYAVFTKVAVYRNWIIEQLLENSEPWWWNGIFAKQRDHIT